MFGNQTSGDSNSQSVFIRLASIVFGFDDHPAFNSLTSVTIDFIRNLTATRTRDITSFRLNWSEMKHTNCGLSTFKTEMVHVDAMPVLNQVAGAWLLVHFQRTDGAIATISNSVDMVTICYARISIGAHAG